MPTCKLPAAAMFAVALCAAPMLAYPTKAQPASRLYAVTKAKKLRAVSYTHLTLPTILLV